MAEASRSFKRTKEGDPVMCTGHFNSRYAHIRTPLFEVSKIVTKISPTMRSLNSFGHSIVIKTKLDCKCRIYSYDQQIPSL